MISFKKNELYQELEIFDGEQKIGEAEVDIKGKMLSRLFIYPPYQNKGYGTEVVKQLCKDYDIEYLWVNATNERAINVYRKCGFIISDKTMYEMKRSNNNER